MKEVNEDDLTVLATATCGACTLTWDIWVTEDGVGRLSDLRCPGCDGAATQVVPHEALT